MFVIVDDSVVKRSVSFRILELRSCKRDTFYTGEFLFMFETLVSLVAAILRIYDAPKLKLNSINREQEFLNLQR